MRTDNKKCQISLTNTNLRENHPCMLRHGVEQSSNQSFIACIADIINTKYDSSALSIVTIKEMLI